MNLKITPLLLFPVILILVLSACAEDPRTPSEKARQEFLETSYWLDVEAVGEIHDLYLDDFVDDEEKKSRESGLLKDAKADLGHNFEVANIIFSEFFLELLRNSFTYFAVNYDVDPRWTLPFCLHYASAFRNITFLERAATPLEAGPYARSLMNLLTLMNYEIHILEEGNVEYLSRDRDKVACENQLDMAIRSADPDSPEYDPLDPFEKPEELPIFIQKWLQEE